MYQPVPRTPGRGYHVSRRVDLSYRRSHNGLFYLISSLVDRLPLDHFRHQGSAAVMAGRKKPGSLRGPTDTGWQGMISWKRIDAVARLLSRSLSSIGRRFSIPRLFFPDSRPFAVEPLCFFPCRVIRGIPIGEIKTPFSTGVRRLRN